MTLPTRGTTRAHAVEEFLDDLSNLLVACYSMPEDEQAASWAADAERITGQVALALATARARIVPRARAATVPSTTATEAASGPDRGLPPAVP